MDAVNIFPLASVWVAAKTVLATGSADPSWGEMAFQYGLPTVLLFVLAKFTFWQEKQRNNREAAQSKERKENLEAMKEDHKRDLEMLREENRAKNQQLNEIIEWMKEKIDSKSE